MKIKREEEENTEGEEDSKRQKLLQPSSPSPHRLAFDNALLPLATYDDDDEEEDDEKREASRVSVEISDKKIEKNNIKHEEAEEEEEDDEEMGVDQGRRNRMIELRKDCPYLDTVNRQVCNAFFLVECLSLFLIFYSF